MDIVDIAKIDGPIFSLNITCRK